MRRRAVAPLLIHTYGQIPQSSRSRHLNMTPRLQNTPSLSETVAHPVLRPREHPLWSGCCRTLLWADLVVSVRALLV